MSEKLEIQWVVSKKVDRHGVVLTTPVYVFDSRADARKYANRMNLNPRVRALYVVQSAKRGPRG